MKLGHYERLVRIGAGALTLLLLHGLGFSGMARAGCNHLVGAHSDPLGTLAALDELIVAGSSTVSVTPQFSGERPVSRSPKPCSGMSCSKSTPLPASTASSGPAVSDQWGTLSTHAAFVVIAAHTLTIDDSVRGSRGRLNSIFHPPPISVRTA
jgi:hypothetical protein